MTVSHWRSEHGRLTGFTLIEMLVVLVLVGIVLALAFPALKGVQTSLALTTAGIQVKECLAMARQVAIARNLPVQVRIYLQNENGGAKDQLRLYQKEAGSDYVAYGKTRVLDRGAVLSTHAEWSSLLDAATVATDAHGTYRAFRFMEDGSVDLTTPQAPTLTVIGVGDINKSLLPANFYTLQLDLQSGLARSFRP